MVYCGKPSRSCHACRERKTRCDALQGGCTQCKNAGRVCPGYRSLVDLTFRSQNENLIKKAQKRTAKHSRRDPDLPAPEFAHTSEQRWGIPQSNPVKSLREPVDQLAACFFMVNFAGGMTFPGAEGIMFASDQSCNTSRAPYKLDALDPILDSSLKAASFACLANNTRNQRLKEVARGHYVKAVDLMNKTLGSDAVKGDSTLLSVNLLGLFETFDGRSKRSMKATAAHIKGAATLLHLRGPEQVRTLAVRQAFLQTTHSLLMSCIQWNLRLPDHIIGMTEDFIEKTHQSGWRAKLFMTMLHFVQFRHDVRRSRRISDMGEIVNGALLIDETFVQCCEVAGEAMQFDALTNRELNSDLVYEGHYHVYREAGEARIWNHVRIFRILIHQQIRESLAENLAMRSLEPMDPDHALQFHSSTDICSRLSADVLASVPQQLGLLDKSSPANNDTRLDKTDRQAPVALSPKSRPFLSGFPLLWPLWIVAVMPTTTGGMRAYCVRTLDTIGDEMGITHALVLADLLKAYHPPTVSLWTDDAVNF